MVGVRIRSKLAVLDLPADGGFDCNRALAEVGLGQKTDEQPVPVGADFGKAIAVRLESNPDETHRSERGEILLESPGGRGPFRECSTFAQQFEDEPGGLRLWAERERAVRCAGSAGWGERDGIWRRVPGGLSLRFVGSVGAGAGGELWLRERSGGGAGGDDAGRGDDVRAV